jgi:hypothetical protein
MEMVMRLDNEADTELLEEKLKSIYGFLEMFLLVCIERANANF